MTGFAAKELATRIRHLKPKAVLTASCGVEPGRVVDYKPILEEALGLAGAPDLPVVVYQRSAEVAGSPAARLRPGGLDLDWAEAADRSPGHDCVDVEANEPLYMLYTSGTTGEDAALFSHISPRKSAQFHSTEGASPPFPYEIPRPSILVSLSPV